MGQHSLEETILKTVEPHPYLFYFISQQSLDCPGQPVPQNPPTWVFREAVITGLALLC